MVACDSLMFLADFEVVRNHLQFHKKTPWMSGLESSCVREGDIINQMNNRNPTLKSHIVASHSALTLVCRLSIQSLNLS